MSLSMFTSSTSIKPPNHWKANEIRNSENKIKLIRLLFSKGYFLPCKWEISHHIKKLYLHFYIQTKNGLHYRFRPDFYHNSGCRSKFFELSKKQDDAKLKAEPCIECNSVVQQCKKVPWVRSSSYFMLATMSANTGIHPSQGKVRVKHTLLTCQLEPSAPCSYYWEQLWWLAMILISIELALDLTY